MKEDLIFFTESKKTAFIIPVLQTYSPTQISMKLLCCCPGAVVPSKALCSTLQIITDKHIHHIHSITLIQDSQVSHLQNLECPASPIHASVTATLLTMIHNILKVARTWDALRGCLPRIVFQQPSATGTRSASVTSSATSESGRGIESSPLTSTPLPSSHNHRRLAVRQYLFCSVNRSFRTAWPPGLTYPMNFHILTPHCLS